MELNYQLLILVHLSLCPYLHHTTKVGTQLFAIVLHLMVLQQTEGMGYTVNLRYKTTFIINDD